MSRPIPTHHTPFPVRTDDDDAAEAAAIARGDDWQEDQGTESPLDVESLDVLPDDDAEADEPEDGPV